MKHLMKRIDKAMDDYSIKKKFLIKIVDILSDGTMVWYEWNFVL